MDDYQPQQLMLLPCSSGRNNGGLTEVGTMEPISSVPRVASGVNFLGQGVNTSISIFYNKGNLEELALGEQWCQSYTLTSSLVEVRSDETQAAKGG
jgi:hypothetical protein